MFSIAHHIIKKIHECSVVDVKALLDLCKYIVLQKEAVSRGQSERSSAVKLWVRGGISRRICSCRREPTSIGGSNVKSDLGPSGYSGVPAATPWAV